MELKYINRKTYAILFFITTISLLWMALYNGYPLVESDTGSYIFHGFHLVLPSDRSVFYCLFVRLSSLGISLWFTVVLQALILSYALLACLPLLLPRPVRFKPSLAVVLSVAMFTPVAWVTGFVMPDVFTGILLLLCILFLYGSYGTCVKWLYSLFILIVTLIHNSHFPILFLFSAGMALLCLIIKNKVVFRRALFLMCISVTAWATMCTIHMVRGHGYTYSRGAHVFIMGRLAETGILKKYLDENCATKNFKFCTYKNDIPSSAIYFLWDARNSPLYKTGGWDSSKQEYDSIIHGILTTPRYFSLFACASATGTVAQIMQLQIGDKATRLPAGSTPWKAVKQYFPAEVNSYTTSRQNGAGLFTYFISRLYAFFVLISCCAMLLIVRKFEKTERQYIIMIYLAILLFILCNAFITATFSTVWPRFEYRVLWVLPFINIIVLVKYFSVYAPKRKFSS